jgi:hypothetical protein
MQQRNRNPQNNLPEPLGTIVILANFGLGVWNAYSNARQEAKQTTYDKHQQEIICLLKQVQEDIGGKNE